MEHKKLTQEKAVSSLTDEELNKIALDPETFKTIEAVIQENPQFKDMTFIQLKNSKKFQKALKEYRIKYPLSNNPANVTILKSIATLSSTKVNDYVIPNTKVANMLPSGQFLIDKLTEVVVSGQTSKTKEVTTTVILSYNNDKVTLRGRYDITAYDRVVHNAIVSIKKAGNKYFTPAMVYRTMNGFTEDERLSPAAITKLIESIEKLSATRAIIDFTEEAKMYRKNVESANIKGYLIEVRGIEIKAGGEIVSGYEFISEKDPILYEHAKVSGQIYTIDVNLLQTKEKVRSTEEVIVIREYLVRQIEWIKSEKVKRSENITYQGVYEELEISKFDLDEKAYKEKTFKIRNHVKSILEIWKGQKYIEDFKEYKEGKSLKGITIKI